MPAYAKLSLVTSTFHPSDIAFAHGWSRLAPGMDGWRILLGGNGENHCLQVIPPGAEAAAFAVLREGGSVVLMRVQADGRRGAVLGHFRHLRKAVLALCPLDSDALEEIHTELERRFPRARDR